MGWSTDYLFEVFSKTDGACRYCKRQLAWTNYGRDGRRGAWEVDHSIPRSHGGSDHMNNLFAACIPCNRDKSDLQGRSYLRRSEADEGEEGGLLLPILGTVGVGLLLAWLASRRDSR